MPTHLKREKLYSQIWSRPIGRLARDFRISTAKLHEVCKLMSIPIPAVGHWAAVRAGRAEAPQPLPQHSGPVSITLDGKPRETLVERIERTTPLKPKLGPARAATVKLARIVDANQKPSLHAGIPRVVPIRIWGALVFGEYVPHYNTLLRWVHEGRIQPQPVKMGHKWFVKPDAEYIGD